MKREDKKSVYQAWVCSTHHWDAHPAFSPVSPEDGKLNWLEPIFSFASFVFHFLCHNRTKKTFPNFVSLFLFYFLFSYLINLPTYLLVFSSGAMVSFQLPSQLRQLSAHLHALLQFLEFKRGCLCFTLHSQVSVFRTTVVVNYITQASLKLHCIRQTHPVTVKAVGLNLCYFNLTKRNSF